MSKIFVLSGFLAVMLILITFCLPEIKPINNHQAVQAQQIQALLAE